MNHYLAVERGEHSGKNYLMIHCGSRNLGKEVFDYYQARAVEIRDARLRMMKCVRDCDIKQAVADGRVENIQGLLDAFVTEKKRLSDDNLAYLEGPAMEDYLHDMNILRQWSFYNHQVIAFEILNALDLLEKHDRTVVSSIHNYVDVENRIIRKGAISAQKDELGIIPMNMRDGSLIVVGKGNEDYLCSAPHGAGRIMSRSQAKRELDLVNYQKEMSGIYTSSVTTSTLDEAPDAYKKMEDILPAIEPTVDIIERTVPIFNYKAH